MSGDFGPTSDARKEQRMVTQFRKKPVVIEAMEYQPERIQEIWDWAGADNIYGPVEDDSSAYILTLEGRMEASPGEYT